jgi:hypothetical protein
MMTFDPTFWDRPVEEVVADLCDRLRDHRNADGSQPSMDQVRAIVLAVQNALGRVSDEAAHAAGVPARRSRQGPGAG